MRICIPTIDDRGPEGLPSAHFGASPFFTFFDLDTGEWEAVSNHSGSHEHGACRPLDALMSRTVDAVLCGGLGGGAFSRLRACGIRVYLTREPDTRACLEAFKAGRLREIAEAEVCQGHQHHHGDGAGHGHGHGRGEGRGQGRGRGGSLDTSTSSGGGF